MLIKTIKVMLLPNNKQNTKLFQCAGTARWVYNWTLSKEKENYTINKIFLNDGELRKKLTQEKKTDELKWLNNVSAQIPKQAVKDACNAYQNFFKHQSNFPKFKSKRKSIPSFYVDNCKIEFSNTHVKLEKLVDSKKPNRQVLNWVKLSEKSRIPIDCKYYNPRVTYDGIHWWISIGVDELDCIKQSSNDGIGIDIGIKDLAICSDESIYKNINKSSKVKKLKKKKRRLQRKISKKYLKNKKGERYCKTSNIIKSKKKFIKLNHRLTNIRHNYLHQVTSEIVKREPSFIVLEDLNVKGMMKNKYLAKAVQEQCFYEFYRQLQYKCHWNNIKFITANRFFPSSKLCSVCGCIKKDLKLSDRTYVCTECGNIIDRDYQAALNLYQYGLNELGKINNIA